MSVHPVIKCWRGELLSGKPETQNPAFLRKGDFKMSKENKDEKTLAVNETADATASDKGSNEKSTVTDEPQHEEHLPDADDFMEDWRSNIDAAIAMEKIGQVEKDQDLQLGLSFEQVKTLIKNNVPVDSGVINEMVIVKEADGNLANYIETSVLGTRYRFC
jgi:hypothetical protein